MAKNGYHDNMKRSVPLFFLIAIFFGIFYLAGQSPAFPAKIYRVSDGKIITKEQFLDDLKRVKVVFVGEAHTDEFHHLLELDIIKALREAQVPMAVGLEMFAAPSQGILDGWTSGGLGKERFVESYYRNWGFPWPLYSHIFDYLREKRIYAIALNLPQAISDKVAAQGFDSLTAQERAQIPPGVSCSVDERYRMFIRRAYEAHNMSEQTFNHFCEAQILWDKTMAWHLAEYLKDNPRRTVVVLSGTGHAWKRGIPEQLQTLTDDPQYRVVLPELPDRVNPTNISVKDADYLLLRK
jgi:uncharacterized iron-regulated protein